MSDTPAPLEGPHALRVLLVHGPNLNLLGVREPGIYGAATYAQMNEQIAHHAGQTGMEVRVFQSNHEGAIIDALHDAMGWADAVIINPGAYTHTSYAIADALRGIGLPSVEVHLTNTQARDEWRHRSVTAPATVGQIAGFGTASYLLALDAVRTLLSR